MDKKITEQELRDSINKFTSLLNEDANSEDWGNAIVRWATNTANSMYADKEVNISADIQADEEELALLTDQLTSEQSKQQQPNISELEKRRISRNILVLQKKIKNLNQKIKDETAEFNRLVGAPQSNPTEVTQQSQITQTQGATKPPEPITDIKSLKRALINLGHTEITTPDVEAFDDATAEAYEKEKAAGRLKESKTKNMRELINIINEVTDPAQVVADTNHAQVVADDVKAKAEEYSQRKASTSARTPTSGTGGVSQAASGTGGVSQAASGTAVPDDSFSTQASGDDYDEYDPNDSSFGGKQGAYSKWSDTTTKAKQKTIAQQKRTPTSSLKSKQSAPAKVQPQAKKVVKKSVSQPKSLSKSTQTFRQQAADSAAKWRAQAKQAAPGSLLQKQLQKNADIADKDALGLKEKVNSLTHQMKSIITEEYDSNLILNYLNSSILLLQKLKSTLTTDPDSSKKILDQLIMFTDNITDELDGFTTTDVTSWNKLPIDKIIDDLILRIPIIKANIKDTREFNLYLSIFYHSFIIKAKKTIDSMTIDHKTIQSGGQINPEVLEFQKQLVQRGYTNINPSGIWDDDTQFAYNDMVNQKQIVIKEANNMRNLINIVEYQYDIDQDGKEPLIVSPSIAAIAKTPPGLLKSPLILDKPIISPGGVYKSMYDMDRDKEFNKILKPNFDNNDPLKSSLNTTPTNQEPQLNPSTVNPPITPGQLKNPNTSSHKQKLIPRQSKPISQHNTIIQRPNIKTQQQITTARRPVIKTTQQSNPIALSKGAPVIDKSTYPDKNKPAISAPTQEINPFGHFDASNVGESTNYSDETSLARIIGLAGLK